MTAKELKRLRRSDLLEMLLKLRKENDQLREQLAQAQQQLENRGIEIENAGSLAEAALRLNGIFEAAQAACDQYTENVRRRMEAQERETREKCEALLAEAGKQADANDQLPETVAEPVKQDGAQ